MISHHSDDLDHQKLNNLVTKNYLFSNQLLFVFCRVFFFYIQGYFIFFLNKEIHVTTLPRDVTINLDFPLHYEQVYANLYNFAIDSELDDKAAKAVK